MICEQVEARIAEIEGIIAPLLAEREQLRAVSATFGPGTDAPVAAPVAAPRIRKARTRPAAGGAAEGGSRAQEAIKLIVAKPGLSAAEVAAAMGISRNYLYRVLPKLEQTGAITKQGRGYHPA